MTNVWTPCNDSCYLDIPTRWGGQESPILGTNDSLSLDSPALPTFTKEFSSTVFIFLLFGSKTIFMWNKKCTHNCGHWIQGIFRCISDTKSIEVKRMRSRRRRWDPFSWRSSPWLVFPARLSFLSPSFVAHDGTAKFIIILDLLPGMVEGE